MKYTADDIKVISWPEPVRNNPSMYRVSSGVDGCIELLSEVLDSMFSEEHCCNASSVEIRLTRHKVVVFEYNGKGMPSDSETINGVTHPLLYRILMGLSIGNASGNTDDFNKYGHLYEVGPILNAVCKTLRITTSSGDYSYSASFHMGCVSVPLHRHSDACPNALQIIFDPTVMGKVSVSLEDLKKMSEIYSKKYRGVEIKCS